jgi:amidase
VKGPLARSVADAALLMSVLSGADPRDPGSYPSDPALFTRPLERDFKGTRVAWCPDLGGLPLDPAVREVIVRQRRVLDDLGCVVEEACPDLHDADLVFTTLRQWRTWITLGSLLETHRDQLKPEAVWEIEAGRSLTSDDVARAMTAHAELLQRVRIFQQTYEFLACVVNQVPPFEASIDWPHAIAGAPMDTYISWMRSAYWITTTFCPAISVPAGFTARSLPIGLQLVGRFRDDFGVLQLAYAFEQATGMAARRPPVSTGPEGTAG